MLNLSRSTNYRDAPNYLELEDNLISHPSAKISLPRHISSLESPQHNRTTNARMHQIAQKCPTNPDAYPAAATNLAVNILRYQLQDSMAQQKHLENLRNNLQHRLAIAQTNKNCQLVTMLQEESRQLETSK
ncbi:MAG: hypothetical protein HC939_03510 [Pleurocapsa sp. SU_5_0]|nr:hypothetical protein [Pleurocapsa sp. SU_5_0]NJO95379.1 hypothetical protein [Pleurocapsa sp. CRU_1_2]NJR45106.1 hypothetical protein [Hyellaceae cyanobacterium CSU_1_1]